MNRVILSCLLIVLVAAFSVEARGGHHGGHPGHRVVHRGHGGRKFVVPFTTTRIFRGFAMPRAPPAVNTCSFSGDPHYMTFKGAHYNLFPEGDSVVFATKDHKYSLVGRHHHWYFTGAAPTIASSFAFKCHGEIFEYNAPHSRFTVNGFDTEISTGRDLKIGDCMTVRRSDTNNFVVTYKNKIVVSVNDAGKPYPYLNAVITSPSTVTKEFTSKSSCGNLDSPGGQNVAPHTSPFSTTYDPNEVDYQGGVISKTAQDKAKAADACRKLHGAAYKDCVVDYLNSSPAARKTVLNNFTKAYKKGNKFIKKQGKKFKKSIKRWQQKVKRAIQNFIRRKGLTKEQARKLRHKANKHMQKVKKYGKPKIGKGRRRHGKRHGRRHGKRHCKKCKKAKKANKELTAEVASLKQQVAQGQNEIAAVNNSLKTTRASLATTAGELLTSTNNYNNAKKAEARLRGAVNKCRKGVRKARNAAKKCKKNSRRRMKRVAKCVRKAARGKRHHKKGKKHGGRRHLMRHVKLRRG